MPQKSGKYTDEDLQKAKELAELLQSFDNRNLTSVANTRVTDKNRAMIIAELLVQDFGPQILNANVIKLFGEDTITKKYAKR